MRSEIPKILKMNDDFKFFPQSLNRKNLQYLVKQKGKNPNDDIKDFILQTYRCASGIVYCLSKSDCEEMAKELRQV